MSETLWEVLKTRLQTPHPKILIQEAWGRTQESHHPPPPRDFRAQPDVEATKLKGSLSLVSIHRAYSCHKYLPEAHDFQPGFNLPSVT